MTQEWGPEPPGWGWGPPVAPESNPSHGPYQPYAPQPPQRAPRRGGPWVVAVAVFAALALLLSGVGLGYTAQRLISSLPAGVHTPIGVLPQVGSSDLSAQQVAQKVSPAVVDINTVVQGFRQSGEAAGTGMIISSSGEVLTNNHVIRQASSIRVTVPATGQTYTADVVGASPTSDVALLKLRGASGLSTVSFADTSNLRVGQRVVAIGNALGQGGAPSVSSGTITALDRSITASDGNGGAEQLTGMIQTDAPISPGDSGGPLADTSGKVIGMVTAGATQGFARTTSTVGFAIPASAAQQVISQIRAGQSSSDVIIGQAGYLGIAVTDLDPATAGQLGLSVSSGALVEGVNPGSPAEAAGITRDSVITAAGGKTVSSSTDLGAALHVHKPGDTVSVTWVDQSGSHTANVTLTSGPAV